MTASTQKDFSKRLQEIADTRIGELSDEQIAALLAERRELLAAQAEAEKEQRAAEAQREAREQERTSLETRLREINEAISPDKDDTELLGLIRERKRLEQALGHETTPGNGASPVLAPDVSEEVIEKSPESAPLPETVKPDEKNEERHGGASAVTEDFGREGIAPDSFVESADYERYAHDLEAHRDSLGRFLQDLPQEAKMSRTFMLKVADIDPAYAMHYADKDTLKKDAAFNARIAGLPNLRNSGNALAEMLPEMRTGQVVLAGVRQDYRNIRFLRPEMPEYDEIIEIAKRGAKEKVKELKHAADVALLVPKMLQKDKVFMAEIQKLAESQEERAL